MNNKTRLLKRKHKQVLIAQTKTKPQETLEFRMNKQKETFFLNPSIKLSEEGKWFLAMTYFKQPTLFLI